MPLKTITVDKINYKEFDGKFGKSFKVGILTRDKNGQDQWINGFCKYIPKWKQGDEVELDLYNDEKWGLQFKIPNKTHALEERLKKLETEMAFIKGKLGAKPQENATESKTEANNDTPEAPMPEYTGPVTEGDPNYIDVNNIPF